MNLPIDIFAQVSPEILPDNRVTFRLSAKNAKEVIVEGQFGNPLPLQKDEKGVWAGTTSDPVIPGIHEYCFLVDGMRTIDPGNSVIKPQRWPDTSLLHIPASPPAHWDLQDIPHGTLHHHDYFSTSLGKWRKLIVYTPPGWNSGDAPLPVLYLSHGYSDNEASWSRGGKVHWILDSMIHEGKVTPMIIVMADAHSLAPEAREYEEFRRDNTQAFATELTGDIIPYIEARYPVIDGPGGRAFAGLSMGGGHAFTLAFQESSLFSWIGAFSTSVPSTEYLQAKGDPDTMNSNLKLFWVVCGDQDYLFDLNQEAHSTMERLGINHTYVVTPGDDHSWPVWRRYLVEFLPMLFRD